MATKERAATVRIMFKLPPGYPAPTLVQWAEFVEEALRRFKRDGNPEHTNIVCSYADFDVIDAMLIPPEKG